MKNYMKTNIGGFSMIEVLISVVILGFGLLALASLQTVIIRSSAEAKTQSVALQLAKDKIEDLRSFENLAGYDTKIVDVAADPDNPITISGVAYTRSWVVNRFAYNSANFVPVQPDSGAITTAGTFVPQNEYKRVLVTVKWNDASGIEQSIALNDAIGAVSPSDGSKVTLDNSLTSQARLPEVLIDNPGLTGGVIPIAVGNSGSSTAASNPTPLVKDKTEVVSETRFEVLTYAGNSGNVIAQSRVETAVVPCTCSTANKSSDAAARGYRPTFWNGYRYSIPQQTTDAPAAGWVDYNYSKNEAVKGTTESDKCVACCRDHRDPSGVKGAKFDPWRTTHDHYLRSGSSLTLANSGTYTEVCRLIRVDGIFRVAADFQNDYYAILEANNTGSKEAPDQNSRPYAPKVDLDKDGLPTARDSKAKYQNFVLDYMDDRFSNNGAFTYNMPLSVSAYELTYDLNSPTVYTPTADPSFRVPLLLKSTPTYQSDDSKWHHSRGLYIDWIEPEAEDYIKNARKNCVNKTDAVNRNGCVLPYVPFTSINLTELADWRAKLKPSDTSTDVDVIQVANNGFYDPDFLNVPTRGNVFAGDKPDKDDTAYAITEITESNSGIALMLPIDLDEATLLTDDQQYTISDSVQTDPGSIKFFVKTLDSSATMVTIPQIGDKLTNAPCAKPAFIDGEHICAFAKDSDQNIVLKVSGYTKSGTVPVPNGCRTTGSVDMPVFVDYDVTGGINQSNGNLAAVLYPLNPQASNASADDTSYLYFKPVNAGNTLQVQFSGPKYYCPSNYNAQTNIPNKGTPDSALACSGSGSNNVPKWNAPPYKDCTSLIP